jgi:transposase
LFSILANAERYQIEPFAYVRALLVALSSDDVELESLLPDVWIAAHPEHIPQRRRDEAEAAANSRRRRRALRREKARGAEPESPTPAARVPAPGA